MVYIPFTGICRATELMIAFVSEGSRWKAGSTELLLHCFAAKKRLGMCPKGSQRLLVEEKEGAQSRSGPETA